MNWIAISVARCRQRACRASQIERRARPAPVVYLQAHHDERFRPGVRRHFLFAAVARHGNAGQLAGRVLTAQGELPRLLGRNAPQRLEHLELLVADGFGLEDDRRFHCHDRQQLQHVVFDHVAEGADLVVVPTASLDAHGLGDRQLDVIDEVSVPDRFEDAVGQPKRQQILNRLLSQVVIDAIHLRLAKDGLHRAVQVSRRVEVNAKGFFDDQAAEAVLVAGLVEPGVAELRGDDLEELGWCRQIENAIALRAVSGVDAFETLAKGRVARPGSSNWPTV